MIWQIFHLPLKIGAPAVGACRKVEVGSFSRNPLLMLIPEMEVKRFEQGQPTIATIYHSFQCGTMLWKMAKGLCFS